MKSSGYPVLDNRPIDQWKVTELKEELKRRKLPTKGLKEELVRRLDEDMQKEIEVEKQETENGVEKVAPGNVIEAASIEETTGFETSGLVLGNSEIAVENVGDADDGIVKLGDLSGQVEIEDSIEQPIERKSDEDQHLGLGSDLVSEEGTLAKNDLLSSDSDNEISENLSSEKPLNEVGLHDNEMERDDEGSRAKEQSEDVKPIHEDVKLDSSDSHNQVSEVSSSLGFPVKSNSISTDNVCFNEKNELKDNIIADNVKLESDVKPEMVVQPSSSNLVPDDGESHPSDVEEPHENKVSVQDTDSNVAIVDVSQKNYSADLGSSEKLNLDRSSGDDSMEEDALEIKHIDSNYNSEEVVEKTEKKEFTTLKEKIPVATMDIDISSYDKGTHSENSVADASTDKRKLSDQEAVSNNEPTKRQRRWKSESNNSFKEPQISSIPPQSPVKDVPQPAVLKRNFSGSKFVAGVDESPKEREVPPSSKPATNSLRIDRFLRPFTLKAVQELLAKTGTVASFWMDHIKTHCYVTYSSIEEAVETRNAVYNLQWPPNGGRNLVAEFVDPEEVKARLEPPPPPPPAPPVSSGPPVPEPPSKMPQPSPRQRSLKDRMAQPPTLLPPPPLTDPPHARDQAFPLPPPPPQNEKVEAPIVTLDDLFRKTKATPRIYYLPLSEEQVNAVLEARRSNSTKQ